MWHSLYLHLSPNTLTSWWPPTSLNHLLTRPSSVVCRSKRSRLGWAKWPWVLVWPPLVCLLGTYCTLKDSQTRLAEGWRLGGVFPSSLKGFVTVCVRAFWTLLSSTSLLSDFLSWAWFGFPVSTTGMSTLTSSPHFCFLAQSGRSCQSYS